MSGRYDSASSVISPTVIAFLSNQTIAWSKHMVELVIAACLATGECRETRLTYIAEELSPMTCVVAGQAEIARWQQQHPAWQIKRWHCGRARQGEQAL